METIMCEEGTVVTDVSVVPSSFDDYGVIRVRSNLGGELLERAGSK